MPATMSMGLVKLVKNFISWLDSSDPALNLNSLLTTIVYDYDYSSFLPWKHWCQGALATPKPTNPSSRVLSIYFTFAEGNVRTRTDDCAFAEISPTFAFSQIMANNSVTRLSSPMCRE